MGRKEVIERLENLKNIDIINVKDLQALDVAIYTLKNIEEKSYQ